MNIYKSSLQSLIIAISDTFCRGAASYFSFSSHIKHFINQKMSSILSVLFFHNSRNFRVLQTVVFNSIEDSSISKDYLLSNLSTWFQETYFDPHIIRQYTISSPNLAYVYCSKTSTDNTAISQRDKNTTIL
jgi:hypothetical protein